MLYKEVLDADDCTLCPFYTEFCSGKDKDKPSSEIGKICDAFIETDDLEKKYILVVLNEAQYELKMVVEKEKQLEQEKKRRQATEKRRESRLLVCAENKEIRELKKKINANNKAFNRYKSLIEAVKLYRRNGKVIPNKDITNPYEKENLCMEERIRELEESKRFKLEELRQRRKCFTVQ